MAFIVAGILLLVVAWWLTRGANMTPNYLVCPNCDENDHLHCHTLTPTLINGKQELVVCKCDHSEIGLQP